MTDAQSAPGATQALARFAAQCRLQDFPPAVRRTARHAITDCLGTVLAGLDEESVRKIHALAARESGPGAATVLGTGQRLHASAAALANGASAHALDYDNISLTVSGFIASPVLFALLAVAEEEGGVSGKRLLEAFITGWEVECAIARGLGVDHYARGWHSTSTLGHFGAAIAVGKLLGFDETRMRHVLGVAASEASGLRTMIGNMVNPFHVGKAARNAVVAARLVQDGFTAHQSVLEVHWGFCEVFSGRGNYSLEAMVEGLGSRLDLVDPGLVIKFYPCCGLIHSALDGVIDLMRGHGLRADAVAHARIAVHELVPPTMSFHQPRSGYEAKFSTPFCVALALAQGSVRLADFTDARVHDPALLAIMPRVEMVVHPELHGPETFLQKEFTDVELRLVDGRVLRQRVMRMNNIGSKGRPLDDDGVRAKFMDCASGYADRAGAEQALGLLEQLEDLPDVGAVARALRR
ncbi:MAG TPA: MmgE/PrpD family protein [Ramlibacter sp.]|nr:MmgE/PrpD family protein [Ramlibacter sp.]